MARNLRIPISDQGRIDNNFSSACQRQVQTRAANIIQHARGFTMKKAVLFCVPLTTTAGVCWRWRSTDGNTDSAQSFMHYVDCVHDAESHGYHADATPPMLCQCR